MGWHLYGFSALFILDLNLRKFVNFLQVEGWKDSVHCAAWSTDGQHLALCDMAGTIKVRLLKNFRETFNQKGGNF